MIPHGTAEISARKIKCFYNSERRTKLHDVPSLPMLHSSRNTMYSHSFHLPLLLYPSPIPVKLIILLPSHSHPLPNTRALHLPQMVRRLLPHLDTPLQPEDKISSQVSVLVEQRVPPVLLVRLPRDHVHRGRGPVDDEEVEEEFAERGGVEGGLGGGNGG